jgi:hypothetical protein
MIKTKKEALAIVGGLSNSSKMPETAHGTPAHRCGVGSKLREKEGSVCHGCYALKGRCGMPKSVNAQERRLDAMYHLQWTEAMVLLLKGVKHHRWFDTGDIPDRLALSKIFDVCLRTPRTKHWLPTRERKVVQEMWEFTPANLVIRLSAPMINQPPVRTSEFPNTSTVHLKGAKIYGYECPAKHNMNQCGDCRACWDKRVKNVSYEYH